MWHIHADTHGGTLLKRWGFTPQKPIRRAYEQRPEAVKQWLNEQYPDIAKRARTEGGEIHWGDETGLVNTDVRGRGFAPKGKTPVTYASSATASMIATVTNKGCARWQIMMEISIQIDSLNFRTTDQGCREESVLDLVI